MCSVLALPFICREFASGLKVMQSVEHGDDVVCSRILEYLSTSHLGLSAVDLAKKDSIPVALAREQLLMLEQKGLACRDDTISGLFWYPNLFN